MQSSQRDVNLTAAPSEPLGSRPRLDASDLGLGYVDAVDDLRVAPHLVASVGFQLAKIGEKLLAIGQREDARAKVRTGSALRPRASLPWWQ